MWKQVFKGGKSDSFGDMTSVARLQEEKKNRRHKESARKP